MLYGHIRSKPLAFRHSLSILFPYTPHCTVAETVVKNASRLFLAGVLLGKVGRHFLFLTTHIVTPGAKLHKLLLLETAQDLRGSIQRGKKRFFTRFPLILCRFRSIPLAFRHSLKALFPCAPHCTVAEDVVKTLPGPCRLKTQAKTRKRFCLDCPHCNFAGKMKHSFLCRTRLRNWGAVNKKGDLK